MQHKPISFGLVPYKFDANGYTSSVDINDIVRLVKDNDCTLVQVTEGDDEKVEPKFYLFDLKQKVNEGDDNLDREFHKVFDENYRYLLVKDGKALFYKEAGR